MKLTTGILSLLPMIFFYCIRCSVAVILQDREHGTEKTVFWEYLNVSRYLRKDELCLKPYIDMKEVRSPRVNDNFTLSCSANFIDWSGRTIVWNYPQMGKVSQRISETSRMKEITTLNYQYVEITSYLTIRNALTTDSGKYTCTVPDSPRRINFAQVNIEVYGGAADDDFFPPPVLSVSEKYINLQLKSTLNISCFGNYGVSWRINEKFLHGDEIYNPRSSLSIYVDTSKRINKYRSYLTITDLELGDAGMYTCLYTDSLFSDTMNKLETFSSVYVFVKNVNALFLPKSNINLDLLQLFEESDLKMFEELKFKGTIPCIPTSSDVNVTLWKNGREDDEYVSLGRDVIFDPTRGFTLSFPSLYFTGRFQCKARKDNVDEVLEVRLRYKSTSCPSITAVIDKSEARHLVVDSVWRLKCTAITELHSKIDIEWFLPYSLAADNRSYIETSLDPSHPGRLISFLTVKNATLTDSGMYRCAAKYETGKNVLAVSHIFIHDSSGGVNISVSSSKPIDKSPFQLVCRAETLKYTHVEWKWKPKASMLESLHTSPGVTVHNESSNNFISEIITFDPIYLNMSGDYECAASNQNSGVTTRKVITVEVDAIKEPVLIRTNLNGTAISAAIGVYVEFFCYVNGFPFPTITWMKDGEILDSANISRIEITDRNQKLTIREFSKDYAGFYQCIITNRGGLVTANATLNALNAIKEPVLSSTNLRGANMSTTIGARVDLYCYADGFPFPTITWMKDGEILDSANLLRFETIERNQMLTIKDFHKNDAGFYECLISNTVGQVTSNVTLTVLNDNTGHVLTKGAIAAVSISVVLGIALVSACGYLVRRMLERKRHDRELEFAIRYEIEREQPGMYNPRLPLEDQAAILPYNSKWEFNKHRLLLGKTLGEGEFGTVVKAEAVGMKEYEVSTTVAVKMLKERATKEHAKALVSELKILANIGQHLNIVNFLGAVTRNLPRRGVYIIIEYCQHGSLRHFLRRRKESFIDQLDHKSGLLDTQVSRPPGGSVECTHKIPSLQCADFEHDETTHNFEPGFPFITNLPNSNDSDSSSMKSPLLPTTSKGSGNKYCDDISATSITTRNLLSYSFQCARGMEYLASKKVIHRDLAARNVLLAEGGIVKICDFGLSKDCKNYYLYIKKSNDLLPIKWMAIESIRNSVFSTKSDVWSFGVLLWEIFTLGGNPYPGIHVDEHFFGLLEGGYRMEKPEYAPDVIYQCMKNCWLHDSHQRPSFSQLVDDIRKLLESDYIQIYYDLNKPYEIFNNELFKDGGCMDMNGENTTCTEEPDTPQNSVDCEEKSVVKAHENITEDMSGPRVQIEAAAMIPLQNISSPTPELFLEEKTANEVPQENDNAPCMRYC